MRLKDLKVTLKCVEGPCRRSRPGTVFYVRNARLEIPEGEGVCLFALASLIAPFIAASIPTSPESSILDITREFQCPDPLAKVIFRVDEETEWR